MNLIHFHVDAFLEEKFSPGLHGYQPHKLFIASLRDELKEYSKLSHKIEFINRVIAFARIQLDIQKKVCPDDISSDLRELYIQNVIFFAQDELENLESQLTEKDFSVTQKASINEVLSKILEGLQRIQIGQQVTYDDLSSEFEELKDLLYLDKKTWLQLFIGKLADMTASGVVSETLSKQLTELIKSHYKEIIAGLYN